MERNLPENQIALVVVCILTGQKSSDVLDSYTEINISIENVPANI